MLQLIRYMLPAFWLFLYHPVHYSVMNIEYNESGNGMNCLLKLFKDDVYLMAFHHYGDRVNEKALHDSIQCNAFIEKYINTMAWFVIDNTDTVHFSLTDRTDENDVLWIRLQAHLPAKFSKLEMSNYLLMDIFPDQTNLVIFSRNEKEFGYQMTYESPTCTLDIAQSL